MGFPAEEESDRGRHHAARIAQLSREIKAKEG
jgi:hypothetical protein